MWNWYFYSSVWCEIDQMFYKSVKNASMLIFMRKCILGRDLKFKANPFWESILHMFLLYLGIWGRPTFLFSISQLAPSCSLNLYCTEGTISRKTKADFFPLTCFLSSTSNTASFSFVLCLGLQLSEPSSHPAFFFTDRWSCAKAAYT